MLVCVCPPRPIQKTKNAIESERNKRYLNPPVPLFIGLCDELPSPRAAAAAAAADDDDAGSVAGPSAPDSSFKTLRLTFVESIPSDSIRFEAACHVTSRPVRDKEENGV